MLKLGSKQKILSSLVIIMVICVLASLTACTSSSELKVGHYPQEIEQGNWMHVPNLIDVDMEAVSVSALYPDGSSVPTRDRKGQQKEFDVNTNMLFLSVTGEYTIIYEYDGKSLNIKFTSVKDVSAPHFVSNTKYTVVDGKNYLALNENVYTNEVFRFDDIMFDDPSGLDYDVCYQYKYQRVISEENGDEVLSEPYEYYQDDSKRFIPDEGGTYKITVPVRDLLGNSAEYYYYFNVIEKFIDADVYDIVSKEYRVCDSDTGNYSNDSGFGLTTGGSVIVAEFDNEKYVEQKVMCLGGIEGGWGDSTDVVSIENVDGRYALKAKYNGIYSPHFMLQIDFFDALEKGTFKNLYITYKFIKAEGSNKSNSINYSALPAQVYAIPYSLNSDIASYIYSDSETQTSAYTFILNNNEWATAKISADKLFRSNDTHLGGLKLCVSGEIYIEKIWVSDYVFTDENFDTEFSNVIMDFDEKGYIYQVEKGSYASTPSVSILSGQDVPAANEMPNNVLNGKGASEGALLIESMNSVDRYASAKINLFKSFSTTDYKYVNFRIYYDSSINNSDETEFFLVFYTEGGVITDENYNKHYYHFITDISTDKLEISDNVISTPVYGRNVEKRWIDVRVDSKMFNFGEDGDVNCLNVVVCGKVYIDKIWLDN